jgi:transcription initiation factor IIF auxiliary subunit
MSMQVDMERLADGLQKLAEDDLLQVVQLVHDNKTAESYIKNDLESKHHSPISFRSTCLDPNSYLSLTDGEFHVDLYTLPDSLVKMLWEFVTERGFGDR